MTDWMLDAARWAASDLDLELGDRTRWFFVQENHGGTASLREFTIAQRLPLERSTVRPIETVLQLRLAL